MPIKTITANNTRKIANLLIRHKKSWATVNPTNQKSLSYKGSIYLAAANSRSLTSLITSSATLRGQGA